VANLSSLVNDAAKVPAHPHPGNREDLPILGLGTPMELLERDREREVLEAAIEESRTAGRVVVVLGEAGIGKTALVSAVCGELGSRRVLWGACDPLITPRPMGPLRDVAHDLGGEIADAIDGPREQLLAATLEELRRGATVLVVEDLHWADDATLDLVALLGRRIARGCLILTCRSDARPEVRRVLGSLPREAVRRIEPEALSEDAVAALARRAGRDPAELYRASGGNPFFVTEALDAPTGGVPASVRESLALRLEAIDPRARAVVELAAVVPGQTETWLLPDETALDAGIAAGLLTLHGDALTFRHELARGAVEDGLSPRRRRELDRLVLAALEARGDADPARLAHHARRTGDAEAIQRLVPAAARAAGAARGHTQALEQWEAVLAVAPGDAEALEGVAQEAYLAGFPERALEAQRALYEIHTAAGDELRAGDALRWIARNLWWTGRGPEARETGERAIAVLEAFPDSHELAMALSGQSQLAMLAEENELAIELGERAVALARRIGDRETLAHALTNVGTALVGGPENERGRDMLEEAFAIAVEERFDDHAARALVNLGTATVMRRRDDPRGPEDIERALRFAREHELHGYLQYMLGFRANLRLYRGDWGSAEVDARAAIAFGEQPGVSLCPALLSLGRLRARRGEPEATATLDEAWRLALKTGELQRIGPAAAARAEHAWLEGDDAGAAEAARQAYELALTRDDHWVTAELAYWLWRAGEPVEQPPGEPTPYGRAMAGDWRGAAEAWERMGCPYERAEVLSDAGEEQARLEALTTFDAFGATRAAAHLRRRLRAAGVRRVPRGPRPTTRDAPAGLTPRETEVLELVVQGATNSEIAQALVISAKTVDHHVSAVLGKLGVSSRREAGAALERLDQRG
jgi:DNA-binding CsgD family transcriptional regulator/tetratricopeptide (TPR) repeat protein